MQQIYRIMNRLHAVFVLAIVVSFVACHKPLHVDSTSCETIAVDMTADALQDSAYLSQLSQVKAQLDSQLSVVIGVAPEALTLGNPESPMLNWASDALLDKARELYAGRVDMAVVNKGGMRCEWQAGEITLRNMYELMPFDNELVVLTLQGKDILELCQVFATDDGQGVAGLRMSAEEKQLIEATIAGKPIAEEAYYTIATSDYLAGGTDHMTPLTKAVETWKSGAKIRDLYIDWVREHKTVPAVVDGRMNLFEI